MIANKKKIKIGWTIVGVTLLKARPLQCFRCWHYGHVKDRCRSQIDRSKFVSNVDGKVTVSLLAIMQLDA